jgi:LPXTG-motif cell wall-anchored protein
VGPTSAFSQLFAIKSTSSLLPALNITTPLAESKAPGGSSPVATQGLNLASLLPTSGLPLGSAILSGALPSIDLTSSITDGVAQAGMTGKLLNNISVLGGLLNVSAVDSTLGTTAAAANSAGFRGLDVNAVSVLNLGALLRGLGIDPANLSVTSVSSLLTNLGTSVAGVPAGSTVNALVATLNDTIAQLNAASGTFGGLGGTLQGTLNGLGLPVATGGLIPDPTQVTTLLTQVTGLLDSVLKNALNTLDNLSLLKLDGLKIGTNTKAAGSTKDSVSEVVGTLGGVHVGNLPVLSGLDLGATLSTVTGLANTVTSTLDGVLAPLGLNGLISIKLFDKPDTNGVSASGGYTRALAGITGVGVAINPPAGLANLISSLDPTQGIGSQILSNNPGTSVPVIGGLMNTLNLTSGIPSVGGVVSALAGGASLKIASVATGSNFAVPADTPAAVSQLPRTGANTTIFLVIGMLMVGGVIAGRRYIAVRVTSDNK